MARWYKPTGELFTDQIEMKKGGFRDPNVKDARKLGLVPSVTSILDLLAKPGLEKWKQGLLMDFIYRREDVSLSEAKEYAYEQYAEERDKSTGFGTRFHYLVEQYFKGERDFALDEEMMKFFPPFVEFLEENGIEGESEKSFASNHKGMGYAGTIDLEDDEWVSDFKTQDTKDTGRFATYPESLWQGAAYTLDSGKKFRNIYISSSEPKLFKIKEYSMEELEKAQEIFKLLLALFHKIKGL